MSDNKKNTAPLPKTEGAEKASLVMKWEGVGGLRCGWTLVPKDAAQKTIKTSKPTLP